MKKRILKFIAVFMAVIMGWTVTSSSIAFARYRYYDYYYPYRYHRYYHRHHHHDSHWSSGDTWSLVGLGLLALIGSTNYHRAQTRYTDKKSKALRNFNPIENDVYRLASAAPCGINYFSYTTEEELKCIKSAFSSLYGEYVFMDNYVASNGVKVVCYFKFTRIYENERTNGKYDDFVADQFVSALSPGDYSIDYDKGLFSALVNAAENYPGSICYRNGNEIVLHKA